MADIKSTAIRAPTDDPANHTLVLRQLKETTEIAQRLRGDPMDSFVRVSELLATGLVRYTNGQIQPPLSNTSTSVPTTRNILTIDSITGGGDLSADRTLSLVNDTLTPGASKYYGTDGGGVRGWFALPGGGSGTPANPTALVGLTVVNGSATTYMRSDAAPPLDQSISPTWTGNHIYTPGAGVGIVANATAGNVSINAKNGVLAPAHAVDRQPAGDVVIPANASAWVAEYQQIAAGHTMTVGAGGELVVDTGLTGQALTEIDDINVTLSLTGLPATALIRPVTMTLGWTGLLAVARGGSGAGTLTGYLKGTGTTPFTAAATIPATDISSGAALTKTDDTNVTLTLGGTPASALLVAASLTLGWTGLLSVGRGGSGAGTLTGYVKGTGTTPFTAAATIPYSDLTGTPAIPVGANPTASVGLTVVNGVAATFMRSDAAPALDVTIAPTWSGVHTYTSTATQGAIRLVAASGGFGWQATGAVADAGKWRTAVDATGNFFIQALNDIASIGRQVLLVSRNQVSFGITALSFGNATDNPTYTFTGTGALTTGGDIELGNASDTTLHRVSAGVVSIEGNNIITTANAANPTALVGVTAVNGSATTFMRSDGAPAIDLALAPTWTGMHTFTKTAGAASNSYPILLSSALPGIGLTETDGGVDTTKWDIRVNSGVLHGTIFTDAGAGARDWIAVTRTVAAISDLSFGNATDNPTHTFLGTGAGTISGIWTFGANPVINSASDSRLTLQLATVAQGILQATGTQMRFAAAGATTDLVLQANGSQRTKLSASTGQLTQGFGSAITAGGNKITGIWFSSTADFGIAVGSGVPTISAAQGSLYQRSDGADPMSRLYVNTDGATGWLGVISGDPVVERVAGRNIIVPANDSLIVDEYETIAAGNTLSVGAGGVVVIAGRSPPSAYFDPTMPLVNWTGQHTFFADINQAVIITSDTNATHPRLVIQTTGRSGNDQIAGLRVVNWDGAALSTCAQMLAGDVNHVNFPNNLFWGTNRVGSKIIFGLEGSAVANQILTLALTAITALTGVTAPVLAVDRNTAVSSTIPANGSVVVDSYYTVAAGQTLTIGAGGVLRILT